MKDDYAVGISKVVGQIEDELRDIKSAKEQVEAVIGSNQSLSDSLRALFDSAEKTSKLTEYNVKQITDDIKQKLEILDIKATDIDSYVQQGITKIDDQYSLTQSNIEKRLEDLVNELVKMLSDTTVKGAESIKVELEDNHKLVRQVASEFSKLTSEAIEKQDGYIAEIGKLVSVVEERQSDISKNIEELKKLDTVKLYDEISEIRKREEESFTITKKFRAICFIGFGSSIVLGLAILINMLI